MGLEFQNCCFCIELRTGSLIIGYLSLIGNIILTLLSIVGLAATGVILSSAEVKDEEAREKLAIVGTAGLVILGILTAILILNLIFTIVLLVGVHQNKRGHVKAYLIYSAIFIVISVIMLITSIASGADVGQIIRDICTIVLSIYFLLVIRSFYLKMDDPAKRPAIYNTA